MALPYTFSPSTQAKSSEVNANFAQHESNVTTGWIAFSQTCTYASATTFTITGDYTGLLGVGMRLWLTQTTSKYFIIVACAYSAPNTTVTVYGGTDYTLANAAITAPYFSLAKIPFGFNPSPAKWQITATDSTERAQTPPVQNTWYNLGTVSIAIPIGAWWVDYSVAIGSGDSGGVVGTVAATLSTANNSESDNTMTGVRYATFGTAASDAYSEIYRRQYLVLAAAATYYLNERTTTANVDTLRINSASGSNTIVRAVCAYL